MKKILFIFLFCCSINCMCQVKPIAGIEYNYKKWILASSQYMYSPIKTICGIGYNYKNLSISSYSEIYMNHKEFIFFSPSLSEFTFKLEYSINKNIDVRYTHVCIHPVITKKAHTDYMYGGQDTFGIYYNFNK